MNRFYTITILLLFISFGVFSQDAETNDTPSPQDLSTQYDNLKADAETYGEFKVFRESKLDEFWSVVDDSLNSGKENINKQKQIIEVAGGGPEVRMKSVSGVLKIGSDNKLNNETHSQQEEVKNDLQSDAVEAVDPQAKTELPSKTQMEILQEIENGELSVDEALKQLNP